MININDVELNDIVRLEFASETGRVRAIYPEDNAIGVAVTVRGYTTEIEVDCDEQWLEFANK